MGTLHPIARIRAKWNAAKRRIALVRLKNSCVEDAEPAGVRLFCAISMVGIGGPLHRLKALELPPSSRMVTFSLNAFSAFATAAFTIFCASSEEMSLFLHHVQPLDTFLQPSACFETLEILPFYDLGRASFICHCPESKNDSDSCS